MEYNILSEEQEQIISLALSGHNIFVTGQAGTGKTTMLRKLVNKYKDTEKQVYVTCTTGVSTMQFENATTIHHWSGIGDGRYTNDEIINKIMNDENFTSCKHRIKSTNVIIIDELAMLSAKNFAQIEKIVRTVKESNILFGGITVIGCGSFKQLAPIANARYFDAGDYCFNVNFWNDLFPQSHCFVLQEVFRTSDFKLIKAINELEEGLPSKETEMFLRSLDRPITAPSDDEIVRLFAKTDDVEMFNSDKLKVLPNDVHTYKCKDINVTKKNSKSFVVPKTLRLKEGAPVLLISNISVFKKLVNGKKGQVVKCNKDSVDVLFDDGSLSVITKVTFTQYDPLTKKVTCMREQIPLILAFAMTVHRSQGMTLHFLEIDCAGMFAPGQMAVAVGRASTIKGLRLRNYNPYAAKLRHKDDVYQFYTKLDSIPTYSVYCTETYPFDTKCCHNDYLDPDKPLYSDNEFNKIEYLPSLKNDIINIVDSMLAIEEQFDQASDIEEPILPLFNIKDIFKFDLENPCTTQQCELLHVYKTLPKQNLIKLWNSIIIFINAHLHPLQGPVAKDWTNFMSQIHSYLTSDTFAQVKEDIFKDVNVSSRDIIGSFSFKCAMKALERCLEKKAQKFIPIVESSSEVNLDESSQAVIRYVAGYIASSLKKKSKRVYEGKHKQDEDCLYSKWQVLNKFEVSFQVLKESTRYPNSLQELDRRMNERGGLCCVNDEVYEMFLDIFRICAKYLLPSNFKTYGTEIGSFAINAVTNDEKIIKKWFEYCCFSIIAECNEDNTDKTWALLSCLLDEMVTIFVNIMLNDLRKKVVDDIGLTKSQALRDKVNNPSTSKTTATVRKTSKSHQALQKNVHSSSDSEENIEYPCCVCNKECIADCIECSYCKVWVHFLCAGITDEDSVVTNDNEEFKCRKCASKTGKGKRLRKKKRYD